MSRATGLVFFCLWSLFQATTIVANGVEEVTLDCDPCIDRETYRIKAIVHGTKSDGFWHQVRDAALQAANDLRVNLEFELYDSFDPEQMAEDITEAAAQAKANNPNRPHALIVTIPNLEVEAAIQAALEHIPIFGMNSGYDRAESVGLLGFVAMDEYLGGSYAANEFLAKRNVTKALFINHSGGNTALGIRYDGFTNTLQQHAQNGTIVEVVELVVEPDSNPAPIIELALKGCGYDAVLLAGGATLEATTSAMYTNGCDLANNLGTFDTDSKIFDAIAVGKLSFAISQQQYLQGALSVVLASVYATTGKTIARSSESEFGIYFSGPRIINLRNLPSDTLQDCEADAFPVCDSTSASLDAENILSSETGGSKCPCTDRTKLKIGGVLHGVTTDSFWDIVFEQAEQAGDDLGIELKLDRLEPQPSTEVWHAKMASKMISLCQEGVDGLFVTIPDDEVVPAIRECEALNIPIVSVNSGAVTARELGLPHHISQLEYPAGVMAGRRLVEGSDIKEAVCLNSEVGNVAIAERCQGFVDSLANLPNITYLGTVIVDKDSEASTVKAIEDAVGRGGNWEGVGIMNAGGGKVAESVISLKGLHPGFVSGTFDLSNAIYDGLDSGVFKFGIDQNPFVQGYMPVWLLTLNASSKQRLLNTFIESGPRFVEKSPSRALKQCTENDFRVCPRPVIHDKNQIDRIRPLGFTMAGICAFSSVFFAIWLVLYRNNSVVRKSQPLFLGMICLGTFLMASSIIPLSIDDSMASEEATSIACMAVPWLFSIGFTTSFSALFSKIWRINKLIQHSKGFKRVQVEPRDVLLPFAVLLTLNVVFMLVWTIVDPMYWDRTEATPTMGGFTSYGKCRIGEGNVSVAMLSCLTVIFFLVVLLANIEAYKARNISTEFSESKYVALVMVGFLQMILLGIPLVALVASNPPAEYFVKMTLISVVCLSLLLLILVPKVIHVKKQQIEKKKPPSRQASLSLLKEPESSQFGLSVRRLSLSQPEASAIEASTAECGSVVANLISKDIFGELANRLNQEERELLLVFKDVGISVGDRPERRKSSLRVRFNGQVHSSDGEVYPSEDHSTSTENA